MSKVWLYSIRLLEGTLVLKFILAQIVMLISFAYVTALKPIIHTLVSLYMVLSKKKKG